LKLNLDKEENFILNGDLNGKTFIRTQKNGKIISQFNDHFGAVKEVLYNSSKKVIVSCGMEGSVTIRTS